MLCLYGAIVFLQLAYAEEGLYSVYLGVHGEEVIVVYQDSTPCMSMTVHILFHSLSVGLEIVQIRPCVASWTHAAQPAVALTNG